MKLYTAFIIALIAGFPKTSFARSSSTSLEEIYESPLQEHKPLIIWQWMDGLVTKEGIKRDFEAFKEAGLAEVQNFQIGGPQQMRIGNPENAIGNENWKKLLRWTLDISEIKTDSLFSWPESDTHDIRYFSGTATYTKTVDLPNNILNDESQRILLSLGDVKDMASVKVNGLQMPTLWKAPFECDITEAIKPGTNTIQIDVTNLWPNRMIGDELEPDDLEWSEPLVYDFAPGSPRAGCYLTSNPEWLQNGTERPSKGRKTIGCFKFFTADSSLLPSGLLGPVSISLLTPQSRQPH